MKEIMDVKKLKRYGMGMILFLAGQVMTAQDRVTFLDNAIEGGDAICKLQIGYVSSGDNGRGVTWDFRKIGVSKSYKIEYLKDSNAMVIAIEPKALKKYVVRPDSLLLVSYETPVSSMNYSEPILVMKYPFGYGCEADAKYVGKGMYGNKNAVEAVGTIRIEADASGSIILSDEDTLHNVLRVHTIRTSSVGVERDSIFRDSTERQLEIYEIYQWYAQGFHHPVFETHSVAYYYNTNLLSTYRTAFQYLPEIRNVHEEDERKSPENPIGDAENVIDFTVSHNNGVVSIDYKLLGKAHIQALVSDIMGTIYRQTRRTGAAGDDCSMTIDCRELRRGQYVLYLNVNGITYGQKLSL